MGVRNSIELHKEGISDVALRPDDKIFATAGWDGKVRVYSYKKAAPLAILKVYSACTLTARHGRSISMHCIREKHHRCKRLFMLLCHSTTRQGSRLWHFPRITC